MVDKGGGYATIMEMGGRKKMPVAAKGDQTSSLLTQAQARIDRRNKS